MYGAIIGDIVGSKYEFEPIKTKKFPFVSRECGFTDDTVMTVAVAKALIKAYASETDERANSFNDELVREMQDLGARYPGAGYGGMFAQWLELESPHPYNSYGNGSAMRVSPCGLFAATLEEALSLAAASAEVTHNHPEGVKGAQAVAACIFLAKTGATKDDIRSYVEEEFYDLPRSIDDVRPRYSFDVTCQGSVPESIACFLESVDYEDAVRNAVSLGGDADTQGAIAGSIAWSYYRFEEGRFGAEVGSAGNAKPGRVWPLSCEDVVSGYRVNEFLPKEFVDVIEQFDALCAIRASECNHDAGTTVAPCERTRIARGCAVKPDKAASPIDSFARIPTSPVEEEGLALNALLDKAYREEGLPKCPETRKGDDAAKGARGSEKDEDAECSDVLEEGIETKGNPPGPEALFDPSTDGPAPEPVGAIGFAVPGTVRESGRRLIDRSSETR